MLRLYESGSIDDCRNVIFINRNACLSCARCTMVSYNHEYGIVEPRFLGCLCKELSDSVIRVFYGSFAGFHFSVECDFALRESIWPVVAYRENYRMERLSALGFLVEIFKRNRVGIFIAGAPNVAECDVFFRIGGFVDYFETIALEICFHIVEIAVSTIYERGGITVVSQYFAC